MDEQLPEFRQKLPETLVVNVGGQLELKTKVIGNPKPEVTWFRDTNLVVRDNTHTYENQHETHVLRIDPVLLNDEGEYECKVENCLGQVSTFCQVETRIIEDISEDRQSGIFILFDEGSHDEEIDEENEQDNQQVRRSRSATEQIQNIIENISKRNGKMPRPDIKDSGSKSATMSPCQSPIPLQRVASTTSSIDLDASLRITEVTSPTEVYCDHQPLIREDSNDSRDEKEVNILSCGLEITELEDDTIMEEDEEEEEEDEELMAIAEQNSQKFNKTSENREIGAQNVNNIEENQEMDAKTPEYSIKTEKNLEITSEIEFDAGFLSRTSNIGESGTETPVLSVVDEEKSLKKSVDSGLGKITPEKTTFRDKFVDFEAKRVENARDSSEKVRFEISREKYESKKDDPEWTQMLNSSSNAIQEVEDMFERSKRELEEILDIAKSPYLSRKPLRIGSDDDLDDEIDRIRREFARKRKSEASGVRESSKIDFFDIKKSRKVEDIFEKSRKEMREYLEEVRKSRDEFFGAELKEDEWFLKAGVLRPMEEGRGGFQSDRSIRDMKKRWKNEVGKSEKEISSEMGLSWPPVHGLWIESSEGSDTSGSFGVSERRGMRCEGDKSEQADDDTSKLDDDSINDESNDAFEDKEIEGHLPLDGCPPKMSVTRSYESHSYTKSADYFEQSFEYSHAVNGAKETSSKSKTHLTFSESFDDDSKSEPGLGHK